MIAGLVIGLAVATPIEAPLARSSSNSEICRISTEALMKGDIDAAIAAIDPEPYQHKVIQDYLTRLNYMLIGAVKGKKPRLERTLEEINVETYPVSLQIWTFGEDEVYLVGCLFRIEEDETIQIELQLRHSVEEVVDGVKARLK